MGDVENVTRYDTIENVELSGPAIDNHDQFHEFIGHFLQIMDVVRHFVQFWAASYIEQVLVGTLEFVSHGYNSVVHGSPQQLPHVGCGIIAVACPARYT